MSLLSFVASPPSPDVIRDGLVRASEKSFHWVLGWGGLVALGCALEVGETWVSLKDWFRFRRFGSIPEENHGSWLKPIAAIGLLFVVLGIVGETICEAFVSKEETDIRAHDEGLLGQAQQQAASANQVAAQLGKDTQALKTEAETQKGIAESERLARLKLEREMSPRRLTAQQIEEIGKSLKPFAGKTVSVATYRSDPEAMILALQIMEGLTKAGLLVHNMVGAYSAVGLPISLGVVVDTNSSNKPLESALLKALATRTSLLPSHGPVQFGANSEMSMSPLPKGSKSIDAFIFVGPKPMPIPPEFADKGNTGK